ncbi:MAG: exodeoxyribonuclease VII large subunit [Acholeplasmatales bacterium]|nr:exodeoxyribonuclease VII large subunit [Acholeplasmatales bacterium]
MEERYLTVSALTKYIKYKFDHDHNLEEVLLEGEISNFTHHSRGHFYFTLKDEGAQIQARMFASYASRVKFEPKDGDKVFVKGKVLVYEPGGNYQINITELKTSGIGELYLAYEKLKAELQEKGLFNEEHKKPIPLFPKTIGVITSPTGAAIRDIINTISRRYPLCHVILYPANVQGESAKEDIANKIKKANFDNLCDVLIVGRGGGSIEDLWAFNEPVVAYQIYESNIPIISAVGHEIDFTIADFVADKRAATPTAAAELATPDVRSLRENVNYYVDALTKRIKYVFDDRKMYLMAIDRKIDSYNPKKVLEHKREILDSNQKRLILLINQILESKKHQYELLKTAIENNNPLKIMDKGYSISEVDGKIINDVKDVKKDDILKTKMKNGTIISKVLEVKDDGRK